MREQVVLEAAARQVCAESSKPPLIFQIPPEEGRLRLEQAQSSPVFMYLAAAKETWVDTGVYGTIKVFIVCPEKIMEQPGVIFYIHGAGWVFGSFHTHEKLVRELAYRTDSIVVFPEYSRSPEARYPTAIEQCYSILTQLVTLLAEMGAVGDLAKLTVAGDSVGGNMATVMTLMAKERKGPEIHKQLMFYPVTNASFNTESYLRFAYGYYLYREGMMWFWNQYTTSESDRNEITASPLQASLEQLAGLPQAMILNGEADVLRSEGEAYANRLRLAGVDVTQARFQGIIHDFVMLNALNLTNGCRAAMDSAVSWINRKNRGL